MRKKTSVLALGLASLAALTQLCSAEPATCGDKFRACYGQVTDYIKEGGKIEVAAKNAELCNDAYRVCQATGRWSGMAQRFKPDKQPAIPNPSGGGGGSRPKQVNGQSQRTADGGVVMVTPEGKEWVWNGKYNIVVDNTPVAIGNITRSHAVMQGDPDAPVRKVNGEYIRVSDPRYMAAVDAELAKKKAEQDAKNAAAQKAASKQTKDYINGAKDPGGILQHGGTKTIKEDVDTPPRGASGQSGSNTAGSNSSSKFSIANPANSAGNQSTGLPPARSTAVAGGAKSAGAASATTTASAPAAANNQGLNTLKPIQQQRNLRQN